MAVFALAYPGQDGAPGRAWLEEIRSLVPHDYGLAEGLGVAPRRRFR